MQNALIKQKSRKDSCLQTLHTAFFHKSQGWIYFSSFVIVWLKFWDQKFFVPFFKICSVFVTSISNENFPYHNWGTQNNYFNLHIFMSFWFLVSVQHTFKFSIPAVVTQNVTIENCLVCVKSEKYTLWVTLRPLGSMGEVEAKLYTYKIK